VAGRDYKDRDYGSARLLAWAVLIVKRICLTGTTGYTVNWMRWRSYGQPPELIAALPTL